MKETLGDKIRWQLISFLGNHFPRRYCWADLVQWQLGYIDWSQVRKAQQCGYCYHCMTEEEIEKDRRALLQEV